MNNKFNIKTSLSIDNINNNVIVTDIYSTLIDI